MRLARAFYIMARQTYNMGGLFFSSKQAIIEHAKAIKDNAQPGDILTGQDAAFMYDLLRWHPNAADKIGVGVRHIIIRSNPKFGHNEFYLRRVNGSGTEFSYKQCVNPSTPEADFRTACRVAVEPDIIAGRRFLFQESPVRWCPFTGERLTISDGHVDHTPPNTFSQIVRQFVQTHSINPRTVKLTGRNQDNSFRVQLVDKQLEKQWIEYHRANAYLRLISAYANTRFVGQDWDLILSYLHTTDVQDVIVEWKGQRWYYAIHPELKHGVFLTEDKAPDGAKVLDGAVLLIEASLMDQGAD